MSAVSESIAQRMTLGMLAEWYGFDIDPEFASNVTITSLSNAVDTISPGAMYICDSNHLADLPRAEQSGAYAALLPRTCRGRDIQSGIPLVFGDCGNHMLGDLASSLAGTPSNAMAVFAVAGDDDDIIHAGVKHLADFLHMLGNPVAVIDSTGSTSMTRSLNLSYPLGILDVQRTLAVCAEDGVAAVIIAMNNATLQREALESVNVDVLGSERVAQGEDVASLKTRYAFVSDRALALTVPTGESDELAAESPAMFDQDRLGHMSLAVAMVLAAGVRRNNVRSALRVANNLR